MPLSRTQTHTQCPGECAVLELAGSLLGTESVGVWPEHAALKKKPHSAVSGHKRATVSTFLLLVLTNRSSFWTYEIRYSEFGIAEK